MSGEDSKAKGGSHGVSKVRVAHIDNEDEMGNMEFSEVDTKVITSKIGGLLKLLMEIEESETTTGGGVSGTSSYGADAVAAQMPTSSSIAGAWHKEGGGLGSSITLRATEVHSIVEERKRREADKKAAAIVSREREMFLRAALQLLDQRESGGVGGTREGGTDAVSTARRGAMPKSDTNDTIRVGMLKKYTMGSFVKGTASMSYHWVNKYIELRHGALTYTEQDQTMLYNLIGANFSKNIKLTVDTCYCRPVTLSEADEGDRSSLAAADQDSADLDDCVFEISLKGGAQRLWLADSRRDRDAWVRSVNTAMIGSAGDFSLDDSDPTGTVFVPQSPMVEMRKAAAAAGGGASNPGGGGSSSSTKTDGSAGSTMMMMEPVGNKANLNLGLDLYLSEKKTTGPPNKNTTNTSPSPDEHSLVSNDDADTADRSLRGASSEGAAAPYAEDIAKFIAIRLAINDMESSTNYRKLMARLAGESISVTVPVFYVKSSLGGAFQMGAQDMLSRQTLLNVTNSQVWKDLQRDTIMINGDILSGSISGAEGMIGALVRTIVDKADAIRAILRISALNEAKAQQQQQQQKGSHKHNPMEYATFDLTEGQILACARDLLVLCGRTQSGGDTYFCCDNLLVNRDKNLCFLAPTSHASPPLEFSVDIVESGGVGGGERSGESGGRQRSKTTKHAAAINAANKAQTSYTSPHASTLAASSVATNEIVMPSSGGGGGGGGGGGAGSSSVDDLAADNNANVTAAAITAADAGGTGSNAGDLALVGSSDDSGATTREGGPASVQPSLPANISGSSSNNNININNSNSSANGQDNKKQENSASGAHGGSKDNNDNNNGDTAGAGVEPVGKEGGESDVTAAAAGAGAAAVAVSKSIAGNNTKKVSISINAAVSNNGGIASGGVGDGLMIDLDDEASTDSSSRTRSNSRMSASPTPIVSAMALGLGLGDDSSAWEDASTVSDLTLDTMQDQYLHAHVGGAAAGSAGAGLTSSRLLQARNNQNLKGRGGGGAYSNTYSGDNKFPLEVVNPSARRGGGGRSNLVPTNMNKSLFDGSVGPHDPNHNHNHNHNRNKKAVKRDGGKEKEGASGSRERSSSKLMAIELLSPSSSPLNLVNGHKPLATLRQQRRGSLSLISGGSVGSGTPRNSRKPPASTSGKAAATAAAGEGDGSVRTKLLQTLGDMDVADIYTSTMCIRVTVVGESHFRVCDCDPQDVDSATWATVKGTFKQVFFIKSNCNGRPAMSDRLVTIDVSDVTK